ncbi:MAG: hypothetical protein LBN06_04855 [Prevotellaceae bacterium]|nr:hypothetical protein [Prevotellaceae bacterium]
MVNPESYLSNIIVVVPMTSAVLCAVVMGFSVRDSLNQNEIRQKYAAMIFFLMNAAGCGILYLYEFYVTLFNQMVPLSLGVMYLFYISFYRVILRLTTTDDNDSRLTPLHYVPVGLMMVVFSILQWIVIPRHTDMAILFRLIRHVIATLFIIGYTIASFYRLYHYYRKANAVGSLVYNSAGWVAMLIIFCCISTLCGFMCLYVPRSQFGTSPWSMLSSVMVMWMHIELSYHVVVRKYQLFLLPGAIQSNSRKRYHGKLDRHLFEQYIRQGKPYLNPGFRISDLVGEMDVNRSTLSQFVNQTYGINFSRYINRLRLEELTHLRSQPDNAHRRLDELVQQAGFRDIKHYRRVRAQERDESESSIPTSHKEQ